MPRGKTAKSLALIAASHEILSVIQPASLRAVCYQLFIRGLLPSMKKTCVDGVSEQLKYARIEGIIPWEWIVDETRQAERQNTYADPDAFIPAVLQSYRRDRWALQPHWLEVWSEKGTIRGTLAPILHRYGLTFRVMHGHSSTTCVHDVAEESQADPRPLTVFYLGDYDPSGMHMSAVDLPGRIHGMGGALSFVRLAIDPQDAAAKQLPSFAAATKKSDPRYKWFVPRYGETCWELDALSPVDLRAIVDAAIQPYIDWPAWERCDVVEQAEQRSLKTIMGIWRKQSISGQARL